MQLYYQTIGEGKPLIILHGLYGMSDNWLSIAKYLQNNFKVIIVDLRNHGKSPMSNEHNYNCMAEDLKNLFDSLNLESAYIIGHSMGGKVAMNFAANYPTKIIKLIVVDISPKTYAYNNQDRELTQHKKICETLLSLPISQIKTRQQANELMKKGINSERIRAFLLKNLYRKSNNTFGWRLNIPVLYNNLETIMLGFEHIKDKFKTLKFETLFIKGELSGYIQNTDIEWINKNFANAKIKTIPKSSHWVHAEQSKLFLQEVNLFFLN